jgi:hypothetical protein
MANHVASSSGERGGRQGSRQRLDSDGGDHGVDATHAPAAAEAVVPLLPPLLPPRVLDDPVGPVPEPQRREAARAVPDEQHAVVDEGAGADERARHPGNVGLHERRVERDGERAPADQRGTELCLVAVSGAHRSEVCHADGGPCRVEAARAGRARVRVRALLHEAAGVDEVRVGVGHQPARAAVVAARHRGVAAALEINRHALQGL